MKIRGSQRKGVLPPVTATSTGEETDRDLVLRQTWPINPQSQYHQAAAAKRAEAPAELCANCRDRTRARKAVSPTLLNPGPLTKRNRHRAYQNAAHVDATLGTYHAGNASSQVDSSSGTTSTSDATPFVVGLANSKIFAAANSTASRNCQASV